MTGCFNLRRHFNSRGSPHSWTAFFSLLFLRPEKREVHASIGAVLYELRVGGEIVGFAVFQHEQPFRLQQSAAEHQGGKFFQAG